MTSAPSSRVPCPRPRWKKPEAGQRLPDRQRHRSLGRRDGDRLAFIYAETRS